MLMHESMKGNYLVHHGSLHVHQQNGELQVCNIGANHFFESPTARTFSVNII